MLRTLILISVLSTSKLFAVVQGINPIQRHSAIGLRISHKSVSILKPLVAYDQCSGFIAQHNVIITSAHCVLSIIKNYPKTRNAIHSGFYQENNIDENFELSVKTDKSIFYKNVKIKMIQVHPKYKYLKKSLDPNDIAIIWLTENQSIQFDNKILPRINSIDLLKMYDWVNFVGHGAQTYENTLWSTLGSISSKKEGRNQISEITETAMFKWGEEAGHEATMCSSFAPGDSGGPVYNQQNEVIGLITGFSRVLGVQNQIYKNYIVLFSHPVTALMINDALGNEAL
jgi:hypothetical protein